MSAGWLDRAIPHGFADDVIRANVRTEHHGFVKLPEHCQDAESQILIKDCRP